jgi:hypothetical protein
MERQLLLLDENQPDWRLDDDTRARGRRGIEAARQVLASATRPRPTTEAGEVPARAA